MGKHYALHAIIRHVFCHRRVSFNHVAPEIVATAFDRQGAAGIPDPFVERRGRIFAQPDDEEFGDFVVVDGVGVWGIDDPQITGF